MGVNQQGNFDYSPTTNIHMIVIMAQTGPLTMPTSRYKRA